MRRLIVIAGPSGGGKTTHSDGYISNAGWAERVSCASFLKSSALENGWSGEKDIEGRRFLQDHQYTLKAKYGDNVFARKALEECKAYYKTGVEICVIDDHRFMVERSEFQSWGAKRGNRVQFVKFHDELAHQRWVTAFLAGEPWAMHPSELEWRAVPDEGWNVIYNNDRVHGVDNSIRKFCETVDMQLKTRKQVICV